MRYHKYKEAENRLFFFLYARSGCFFVAAISAIVTNINQIVIEQAV